MGFFCARRRCCGSSGGGWWGRVVGDILWKMVFTGWAGEAMRRG